jgi:indolepyruvate ferredoxin oxidoreductase
MTTAEFIYKRDAEFPADTMKQLIVDEVGEGKVSFVDATELASHLLGDTLASNFFMLGYAFQKGYVPVSYDAIDRAIELNGVAIDFNKQAFLWGRRAAHDIDAVRQAAGVEVEHWSPLSELDEIIQYRYDHLLKYQDKNYADKYLAMLNRVKAKEEEICGVAAELTTSFAKSLHKLMAYKDEYEVARLYSDGDFAKKLNEAFEGDYKLQFHMAPPLMAKIGSDGFPVKRTFSSWMLSAFTLLAKLKSLRGTRWDVFAYSAERKAERALRDEFIADIDVVLIKLNKNNINVAIELFALIDDVRGFGHVKEAAINQYRLRREHLIKRLSGDVVQLVDVHDAA